MRNAKPDKWTFALKTGSRQRIGLAARLLLVSGAAFGVASAFAVFGLGARMLIGSRPLQVLTAAILAPVGLWLLHAMLPDPNDHTVAVSAWTASFALGAVVGPSLGGFVLDHQPQPAYFG